MAYTKETPNDSTIHWSDEGETTTVCGRPVGFTFRGAGVTALLSGGNAKHACGRCVRSLTARQKVADSSLRAFRQLAGGD